MKKSKSSNISDAIIVTEYPETIEQPSLADGADNGISFTGLDPILGSLGILIGLLTQGNSVDSYELNNSWFADPINNIQDGITENPEQFESVLAQILGKVGGNAIGIPVKDAALLGTWYPIMNNGQPTGFYIVSYQKDGDTILGVGNLHTWQVPPDNALLDVNVWGLIPFVRIGNGSFQTTFSTPGYPIMLGVAVEGSDKNAPLIDINHISFNGVKVSASIDLASPDPFTISLEILALQLAGEKAPSNRSLADLSAITGEQILETAASLFVGALSKIFPSQGDNILYLAPLLGLSPTVPGKPDVNFPVLGWYDLFGIALAGGNVATPFLSWFNTLSSDPVLLQTWLSCLGGFLSLTPPVLSGTGTRQDPFQVSLITVNSIGSLYFNAGTYVSDGGIRYFYPGLSFTGTDVPLGTSDVVFRAAVNLELAEFQLSGTSVSATPELEFAFKFSLVNKVAGTPLIKFNDYSFGALEAGMSLGLSSQVVPYFRLDQVTTPNTSFDSINLLSPGQLADAGATLLSEGLRTLLGLTGTSSDFSDSIAALIGLSAPAAAGSNWPSDLVPPFSPQGMADSILNPVTSLANYYLETLQYGTQVDGKAAFSYIVQSFGTLLQYGSSGSVTITGDGTIAVPWKAGISIAEQSLPAYLIAYQQPITGGGVQLVFGLSLAPEITVGSTNITASVTLNALALNFPETGSTQSITADWLPALAMAITLPDGYTTPTLGGVSVSVSASQLSALWSNTNGWSWSMYINTPAVEIGGQTLSLGQNLNFSDQSTFQSLVTTGIQTFGPFLVGAVGTMLMRTDTRVGLFTAGALGLLTDISQSPIFPSGLQWNGFTQFTITSFSNPFPDLRTQIAQDFSTTEKTQSLLSLLAWSINNSLTAAPAIQGTGTFADPYKTPLPAGFELDTWFLAATQALGVGIGRSDEYNYTFTPVAGTTIKFRVDLETRLNCLEYNLTTGQSTDNSAIPSFSFQATLSNPDGLLVSLPADLGSVGQAVLGFDLSLTDGQVQFNPVVTLKNVTLAGQPVADAITLQDFLSDSFGASLQSSFTTLLNAAIQAAVQQVAGQPEFQTAYSLLSLMGLSLTRELDTDPYGINIAGWNGLLSNFNTYIQQQLTKVLIDPTSRATLFSFVEEMLGITIPDFPVPLLELLAGLKICGPAELGYPLDMLAVMELASNPIAGLQQRFGDLIGDPVTLARLTSELTKRIPSAQYGNFTFGTDSNGVIHFEVLPENAFKIGGFLDILGGIQLDLNNRKLTAVLSPYVPVLGLSLSSVLGLTYADNEVQTAFQSAIVWGDGSTPAATPLQLYPFDSNVFLNQMTELAPAYALNILLNAVFEEQLLVEYPVIQQLFTGLGLAKDESGLWRMPSLMGILSDPLGWLLSDSVLGYNGSFSIASFIKLLSSLPAATASNGLSLQPATNGIRISGLPYGFEALITGEHGIASFAISTKELNIADGLGLLDNLLFQIDLDEHYQPSVSGSVDISSASLPTPFYVKTGYNKGFLLDIAQGTPSNPSGLALQLLPFLGWGNLAGQALTASAAYLLNILTPQLLQQLSDAGAKAFVDKMTAFGTEVNVSALIYALMDIMNPANISNKTQSQILDELETAAFDWMKARFTVTGAPVTANAMKDLLADVLPGQLSVEGGLLVFAPSTSLPLNIKAGLNSDSLLGLWTGLSLPSSSLLAVSVSDTGVGISIDDGSVHFGFDVNLVVPFEGTQGPGIDLSYISGTGFELSFDPLKSATDPTIKSSLSRELLPVFFADNSGGNLSLEARMTAWLLDVVKIVLPRYISSLVLNQTSVHTWLETPIVATTGSVTAPTPALLLQAASLIVAEGSAPNLTYYLNSVDNLLALTPVGFLGNLLQTLMQQELTLITFGSKSQASIIIGPKKNTPDYYGVTLVAPDLSLASMPNLVLQLGDSDKEWILNSGGADGTPGVGFYIPITGTAGTFSADFTRFDVSLYNVGFDFTGTNGKPLVDLARFQIAAVKPRVVFDLNFNNGSPLLNFGAGVKLEDIGLSLAPNNLLPSGEGSNPIANNILGSGKESSDDNPPTNPVFSVTTGYCGEVYVNLESNTGNGSEIIIPVQRAFGPLFIDSLGLGWEQQAKLLDFLFSGNVTIAGLSASVKGLKVGIPVTNPTDFGAYTVDLAGLDVSFKGGSVEISGGLLKTENPLSYNGLASIKAASFSLMAIGSYAEVPVSEDPDAATVPSLFIFGVLNMPLGGPPAFFITGVAAGFSFNRSLILPAVDKVQEFPLVSGVQNGSFTNGEDPVVALQKLSEVVRPEVGQYWLAAGLKFTSFELINSVALLFLSFGKEWEVNLLGLSWASLPPAIPKEVALAYFELALKVAFKPQYGVISAEAQLTPNSFVLARDCKVTGGFAFYLWYKTITEADYTIPAGDFVITLGGYNPAFQQPVYYPDVPRLGLSWKMDVSVGSVSIAGGAYFAICPTAVMAGGYLNVSFEAGPLKAWLSAYANFLIEWNPFYFNVGIGITVGASFGTTIAGVSITLKVELGAKLQLEGPPTHGSVEVDWYVISFTIPIGDGTNATTDQNLDWGAFAEAFLPADATPAQSISSRSNGLQADAPAPVQQVVKWSADTGLLRTDDATGMWTVNPVPFVLSMNTAIPASTLTVTASNVNLNGRTDIGVRPMGLITQLQSPVTLSVKDATGTAVDLSARNILMTTINNGAPSAMWSQDPLNRVEAPDPAKMLIADALFGLQLNFINYVDIGDIPAFMIEVLQYDRGAVKQLPFEVVPAYPAAELYPDSLQNTAYHVIMNSIMADDVIGKRNAAFTALQASAISAPLDPDLSVMASSADLVFQALPVIAHVGIYQNGGVYTNAVPAKIPQAKKLNAAVEQPLRQPQLQGMLRKYKASGKTNNTSRWITTNGLLKSSPAARSMQLKSMAKTIYDGSAALWKVDDRTTTQLTTEGSLPLSVASFNAHGALQEFILLKGNTDHAVPATTAQVVVHGFDNVLQAATGWQSDSMLTRINGVWALGDGCMMRVQNSQRIKVRSKDTTTGIIEASGLLSKNKIRTKGNQIVQGWIQTVLHAVNRQIGVLVTPEEGKEPLISVTIGINKLPMQEEPVTLITTKEVNGNILFIYEVPQDVADTQYIGVLTQAISGNITGVYGLPESTDAQRRIILHAGGLDLQASQVPTGRVSITSKPIINA